MRSVIRYSGNAGGSCGIVVVVVVVVVVGATVVVVVVLDVVVDVVVVVSLDDEQAARSAAATVAIRILEAMAPILSAAGVSVVGVGAYPDVSLEIYAFHPRRAVDDPEPPPHFLEALL